MNKFKTCRDFSVAQLCRQQHFGRRICSFSFPDCKKNQKIGVSSIGKMYIVCTLVRNAIICLYGNQTSEFFDPEPPTLEVYFQ